MQEALTIIDGVHTGNLAVIGRLTSKQIEGILPGAAKCDIQLVSGMTALELAIQIKCFNTESMQENLFQPRTK